MAETVQRSTDWHAERAGKITASRMADVMAYGVRGQPLKARADYMAEIVCERLSGYRREVDAPAMAWGRDCEEAAISAIEAKLGTIVQKAGFMVHSELPDVGASPDCLIADDAGGEIKCPVDQVIHLETLLHGMPDKHIPQIQCGLWVTRRKRWLFASFDPRMRPRLRLYVQWIERDEDYIARMSTECARFNAEAAAMVAALETLAA